MAEAKQMIVIGILYFTTPAREKSNMYHLVFTEKEIIGIALRDDARHAVPFTGELYARQEAVIHPPYVSIDKLGGKIDFKIHYKKIKSITIARKKANELKMLDLYDLVFHGTLLTPSLSFWVRASVMDQIKVLIRNTSLSEKLK